MPLRIYHVTPKVGIISNPSNASTLTGSATFYVTAGSSQDSLVYQWQLSTNNGSTFSNISGATGTSLSLTGLTASDGGKQYRCIVSSSSRNGVRVISAAALLYSSPPTTPTPTMSKPFGSATAARMSWTNPTELNSYTITGWNLVWQLGTGSPTSWATVSGTTPILWPTASGTTNSFSADGLVRGTIQPYGTDPSGAAWTGTISGYSNSVSVLGVSPGF